MGLVCNLILVLQLFGIFSLAHEAEDRWNSYSEYHGQYDDTYYNDQQDGYYEPQCSWGPGIKTEHETLHLKTLN